MEFIWKRFIKCFDHYMGSRREILVKLQGSYTKLKSDMFDLF